MIHSHFVFQVAIAIFPDGGDVGKSECKQCKPGYHAERNCTSVHDTICAPCAVHHYTDEYNIYQQCMPCSVCGPNYFALSPCTPTSDIFCESCDDLRAFSNLSYRKACLAETDKEEVSMGGSDINVIKDEKSSTNATTDDTLAVELGSGEIPVGSEISFGEETSLSPTEKEVEYTINIDNSTNLQLGNDTDEDGSGHINIVIYDFPTHLTNDTASVTPDFEEDELIPVSSQPTSRSHEATNVTTTEPPQTTNVSTTDTPPAIVTETSSRSSTITTEAEGKTSLYTSMCLTQWSIG